MTKTQTGIMVGTAVIEQGTVAAIVIGLTGAFALFGYYMYSKKSGKNTYDPYKTIIEGNDTKNRDLLTLSNGGSKRRKYKKNKRSIKPKRS